MHRLYLQQLLRALNKIMAPLVNVNIVCIMNSIVQPIDHTPNIYWCLRIQYQYSSYFQIQWKSYANITHIKYKVKSKYSQTPQFMCLSIAWEIINVPNCHGMQINCTKHVNSWHRKQKVNFHIYGMATKALAIPNTTKLYVTCMREQCMQ